MHQLLPTELLAAFTEHQHYAMSGGTRGTKLLLEGQHIQGLNLAGFYLTDSEIIGCTFTACSLRRTDFVHAVLDCHFTECDMAGVDFYKAQLMGARFTHCDMPFARFMRAQLSGITFEHVNLQNADFFKTRLYECQLAHVDMRRTRVERLSFNYTLLEEVDWHGAYGFEKYITLVALPPEKRPHNRAEIVAAGQRQQLNDATLYAWLQAAAQEREPPSSDNAFAPLLAQHQEWLSSNKSEGMQWRQHKEMLRDLSLMGQTLVSVAFTECRITDSNFRNAQITYADLSDSTITESDFAGALFTKSNLKGTTFEQCDMRFVRLWAESLTDSTFRYVTLNDSSLERCHLLRATFHDVKLQGCLLMDMTLEETVLQNVDLRGAHHAEHVTCISAFVPIEGQLQRLEGEALRAWLLAGVAKG